MDLTGAARLVEGLYADVVALQEVDRGQPRSGGADQVRDLAAELGLHGVFAPSLAGDPEDCWHALHGDDPGGTAFGVGLLSRWPVVAAGVRRLPGGGDGCRAAGATPARPGWDREPRVALHAVLDAGGQRLRVTVAHLSYLPWRAVAQLLAAARNAGGGPALLLGDFNLPAPVVRAALPGWHHAGGSATYPAADPRLQLDHVLVRGGVRVRSCRSGPALAGDHLPVVADLELV